MTVVSNPVVSVIGLSKSYTGGLWSRPFVALRGVTLDTFAGEIFGLLGPNGAGKTTLIKTLLGVVRPSGGTAKLFGETAGSIAARMRVGYLPESLRIDRHHTARSALRYYGRMSRLSDSAITAGIDPLLRLVGLEGRDREPVRRFSKGMYQRLGLAQALLHDPDLLILDEPTDGLDPVGRSEVRRLLLELKARGKTIFLNSHILQEVEMVCDRVAIMSQGTVRGIGSIDELTAASNDRDVTMDIGTSEGNEGDDDIGRVLQPIHANPVNVQSMPGGFYRVKVTCDDQQRINATIDAVRQNGWSIIALKTGRRTLEDVFLELVGTGSEEAEIDRKAC